MYRPKDLCQLQSRRWVGVVLQCGGQGPSVRTSCIVLNYCYICCSEMTLLSIEKVDVSLYQIVLR